ncbi:prespore-specific regulator [Thermolongibacillus altinsuensis]|jgi:prespore-specific regulator|uniref:Prespore-specific regulator n=1 Tax=Thermolongibacillus altinsuensis TaxID=575256 RepID=A0A4R1QHW3_9BACL|nr:RsfA family transcriptional regulator [Thermolongibacillus altinsuensis]TCL52687.1 prespore-specific regulator [Thermolongibacillus altinsuensis]GMB09837.1 transcriptional regulator [Thermolongibacillus altinsuensis]
MKLRQDAWTEEEDLLLAETVLRHVREGSTQLNAFEEVGDKLNRTSAACGFRWNAVVRQRYEEALQMAKKYRKQRQRALGKQQAVRKRLLYHPPVPTLEEISAEPLHAEAEETNGLTLDHVISFLHTLKRTYTSQETLRIENDRLKKELNEINSRNKELEKRVNELEQNASTMQEDYETLMRIMNRARKMVLSEEEEHSPTVFKMDKNGNLEKIERIAE